MLPGKDKMILQYNYSSEEHITGRLRKVPVSPLLTAPMARCTHREGNKVPGAKVFSPQPNPRREGSHVTSYASG